MLFSQKSKDKFIVKWDENRKFTLKYLTLRLIFLKQLSQGTLSNLTSLCWGYQRSVGEKAVKGITLVIYPIVLKPWSPILVNIQVTKDQFSIFFAFVKQFKIFFGGRLSKALKIILSLNIYKKNEGKENRWTPKTK